MRTSTETSADEPFKGLSQAQLQLLLFFADDTGGTPPPPLRRGNYKVLEARGLIERGRRGYAITRTGQDAAADLLTGVTETEGSRRPGLGAYR